jgi:hypothetical protein
MNDNIFSSDSNAIQDSIFISAPSTEELAPEPVLVEPTVEPVVVLEPEVIAPVPVIEEVVEPKVEAEKPKTSKKSKSDGDTVALYSTHNLHQSKHGDLTIGYNIVAKEKADFWLRSKKVRLATPEEVAKHFNK